MLQSDKNMKSDVGNTNIMYVRIWGRLVPVNQVDFVQVDPNTGDIEQEIPLERVVQSLMRFNLEAFAKVNTDW